MDWSKLAGKRVFIETFGCTANIGDEMRMRAILKERGCELVKHEREADVLIVNTCIVTKRTELNVLKRLRELKRFQDESNGKKRIIVAGCMPAALPELVREVFGDSAEMLTPSELGDELSLDFSGVIGIVPIAQGCVCRCKYCIVKLARGNLRSFDAEKIREAVASLLRRGAKEIRITAQDCSAYGWDFCRFPQRANSQIRLPQLLRMLTSLRGDFRIRVGMMNPFTMLPLLDEILDAFMSEKVFKFFHVPVQSGSDKVLRDMNRCYKVADFVEIVDKIRSMFEYCTISTDFIIGYPTETWEDFLASLRLLERVRAEKVNITRFSPRPGTDAAKLKDMLEREKKRRSRIFSEAYRRIAYEQNRALEGRIFEVLVTERGKKGGVVARDPAYRTVILKDEIPLGSFCDVRVREARSTYLLGEVLATGE